MSCSTSWHHLLCLLLYLDRDEADDIADNFRKSGSFIPGIRPGKRTSDFINDILTRITWLEPLSDRDLPGAHLPYLRHSLRQTLAYRKRF